MGAFEVTEIDGWRHRLGRVGVWLPGPALRSPDLPDAAAELERLGYGALWIGGGNPDPAALASLAMLLERTRKLVVATGIVNIWAWEPAALEETVAALHEGHPGRFLLGLGVSHPGRVAGLGKTYRRPLSVMRDYLGRLDGAASGRGRPKPFRVLAALRGRMLELAREAAGGAHPYFVPVAHTAGARALLGAVPLLVPEQAAVLEADADRARSLARRHTEHYLTLPNYTNNLRVLGFGDADLDGAGSDRLVDAVVAWGGAAALAGRVREHLAAGADQVAIQPLADAGGLGIEVLRRLAEELSPELGPA